MTITLHSPDDIHTRRLAPGDRSESVNGALRVSPLTCPLTACAGQSAEEGRRLNGWSLEAALSPLYSSQSALSPSYYDRLVGAGPTGEGRKPSEPRPRSYAGAGALPD